MLCASLAHYSVDVLQLAHLCFDIQNLKVIDKVCGAAAMVWSPEGASVLDEAILLFGSAKVNFTHLAFQEAPVGSLSYTDPQNYCSQTLHDTLALQWKVPKATNVLFILGAQKAGTTYLFNLLDSHPGFIGPRYDINCICVRTSYLRSNSMKSSG